MVEIASAAFEFHLVDFVTGTRVRSEYRLRKSIQTLKVIIIIENGSQRYLVCNFESNEMITTKPNHHSGVIIDESQSQPFRICGCCLAGLYVWALPKRRPRTKAPVSFLCGWYSFTLCNWKTKT